MVLQLWTRSVVGEGLGGSFDRCLEELRGIIRTEYIMTSMLHTQP